MSSSTDIGIFKDIDKKKAEIKEITAALNEALGKQQELIEKEEVESGEADKQKQMAELRAKNLEEERQKEIEKQKEFEALKIQTQAEADQLLLEQEKRASDQRIFLAEQEAQAKMNAYKNLFSDLSSLMNTENKALFEVGKVAAYGSTLLSGYESAQLAYAGGLKVSGGNPLVGGAFAAASAAATATQLAGIASTNFGTKSGSPSAGSSSSGGGQEAALQAPTKNVNISVDGDSVSKQQLGSIAEQLQAEIDDGAILTGITFS